MNHIKADIRLNLRVYSSSLIWCGQTTSTNTLGMIWNADCEPDLFTWHHCQPGQMLFCLDTSSPWFKTHLKSLLGALEAITSSTLMTVVELMHIKHIPSSGARSPPPTGSTPLLPDGWKHSHFQSTCPATPRICAALPGRAARSHCRPDPCRSTNWRTCRIRGGKKGAFTCFITLIYAICFAVLLLCFVPTPILWQPHKTRS